MKRNYILVTFIFLFIFNSSNSQITLGDFKFDEHNNGPNVIYYTFYNDIQLIEIDYNNYEKARVDFEDAKQPISSVRPRNYSHNTIIVRNKNGALLHQYNLRGNPYKASDFTTPDKSQITFTHLQIINSSKTRSNYPSYGKYHYYVTENNKCGVIDTLGNPILNLIYDGIVPYNNKFEPNSNLSTIDEEGSENVNYVTILDKKWGFKNNKITIAPEYEELIPLKENVLRIKSKNKYGLIDFKEKIIVKPKYTDLLYKDNFYLYSNKENNPTNGKAALYGIITSKFKIKTKPIYSNFTDIEENYTSSGKYWAFKSDGYGAIDSSGNEISIFKYGSELVNPYTKYYRTNHYEDYNKNYILDLKFNEIGAVYEGISYWNQDLFIVKNNSNYGLIDLNGTLILPIVYQTITNDNSTNLAIIIQEKKYGVIDSHGKIIIPCSYDYVYFKNSNLISVRSENKCGLLDRDGKLVVPLIYDGLESVNYGLFKVKKDGNYGILNSLGKEITALKYDDIYFYVYGYCIAKIGSGFGYLDKSGKEITPFHLQKPNNFEYDENNFLTAKAFMNNIEVTIKENGEIIK